MADELKRVDYTSKDFDGYKDDMVKLIPKRMPEWTDLSDNDPGIVILELIAYQLEKQSYYSDRVANEVFLPTATQRRSVIHHCRLIDYHLSWFTSAKHWQVFEFVPQIEDIVIPKGSLVGTVSSPGEDSVLFELMEDLIIPAGKTGLEKDDLGEYLYKVEVEQGQTIFDEYLGNTTENTQSMSLLYSPVLKDSITVYVEDAFGRRKWQSVEDFIGSKQMDEHFVVEMDEYDKVKVVFGNDVSGKRPDEFSNVYADYKTTNGSMGNVGVNTIVEFYGAVQGFVRTFNPFGPHVLGEDKENIEEAKWRGPASLKVLKRYVTVPDFENGLKLDYPEISKIKGFNVGGNIELYIMPKDGDILTPTQRDEITKLIESKKIIFTTVTLKDPTYVPVNVSIDILTLPNYDEAVIKYSAENIIRELFALAKDFGKEITTADIHYALLATISGIKKPIILAPTEDVEVSPTEIVKLGTLTILVNGK